MLDDLSKIVQSYIDHFSIKSKKYGYIIYTSRNKRHPAYFRCLRDIYAYILMSFTDLREQPTENRLSYAQSVFNIYFKRLSPQDIVDGPKWIFIPVSPTATMYVKLVKIPNTNARFYIPSNSFVDIDKLLKLI